MCPFPRYSWCSFVSPSGFLRPIPKISKYFLARGDFFPKIWRANYGASRASLGGWPGGVSRFVSPCPPLPSLRGASVRPSSCGACLRPCLRSVGLSCRPVPSANSQINGLQTGFRGPVLARLGSVGFICLRAYPVKMGTKGENFHPKFLILCTSFTRPVLSIIRR